ncbi:T9SS type A sorting domain-containing protein [Rhodocytophaga rosea]|uniref:T9SS type A sorting domain-containing protein n=1 Tax=Rhodocytophaga rosea TaxID=2704465 RepID=A0A6C0GUB2_9BACT|nr:T9SS type A sorting domain-containing protein [Rhodocytophaga rosea]QHT71798.1 T9SS type A sorting domain-containing protein [Rhodocytophaga rosea]
MTTTSTSLDNPPVLDSRHTSSPCFTNPFSIVRQWVLVAFMLCLFAVSVFAQASPDREWDYRFGGTLREASPISIKTADGGYLLAGTSDSGSGGDKTDGSRGGSDYWVVKISGNGTKQWDKRFGGSNNEYLSVVIAASDGGYLLGGISSSGSGGDKSSANIGSEDFWIVKIDANGAKLWDRTYGSSRSDLLTSIIPTSDLGYVLGGTADRGTGRQYDYSIIKITSSGQQQWTTSFGGSDSDELKALVPASDGGYLLAGFSRSDMSSDKSQNNRGNGDYWVVKINSSGTKQWDRSFGGDQLDFLTSVVRTGDGGYLLAGYSSSGMSGDKSTSNLGANDFWLVKINSSGSKQWDKRYGGNLPDVLMKIIQTTDGGYLLAGYSSSGIGGDKTEASRGGFDYWMVKINESGAKQWDKGFGGSGSDVASSVTQATDGGYLLAGYSDSPVSGEKTQSSRGNFDYWLMKTYPPDASIVWNKRFGGDRDDALREALQTTDGGYLLAGQSESGLSGDRTQDSRGNADYWVVKINSSGIKQWDKRFGGSGYEYLESAIQTTDGGYLLAGYSYSGLEVSSDKSEASRGDSDYWVVKINSSGTKQWDKRFGGSGREVLNSAIQTTDGGYLLAGSSSSGVSGDKTQDSRGGSDYWLVKISSSGAKQWDKRFGGSGLETAYAVLQSADGGYLLAGSSSSGISGDKTQDSRGGNDFWVVKINSSGTKQWDKRFGGSGSEQLFSALATGNGEYLLAGSSASGIGGDKSQASQGGQDYWVVRISNNGTKQWDKRFGGSGDDQATSVAILRNGDYALGGISNSGVSGNRTRPSRGGKDYWMVRFTIHLPGNFMSVSDKRFGGSADDYLRTVVPTNDGGYLLAGLSLSGIGGDKSETNRGIADYWVLKSVAEPGPVVMENTARIQENADLISQEDPSLSLQASPNPFTEGVTLRFRLQESQSVSLQLYDLQGGVVATLYEGEAVAEEEYVFQLVAAQLPTGLYVARLKTNKGVSQVKLLLQR